MQQYMSPAQAFSHFVENVYPAIRDGLDKQQMERIKNARRDHEGLRKKKDGYVYTLTSKRIKSILNEFAPGQYQFEERVIFTANSIP